MRIVKGYYKGKLGNKAKDRWFGRLMIAPSLIGVMVFVLIPFIDVLRRSFSEAMSREFVGIRNYENVVTSNAFLLAAKNTGKFLVICIPLLLISSLAVSLLLFSIKRFRELFKSLLLLPMAIPAASIVLLWKIFFHEEGVINQVIGKLGIPPENFLNSDSAFGVLIFTYIWKNIGYDMVLWIAGLNGIPSELYEAAAIDGAGAWKKFRYVTLPQLKPTVFIVTVLSLINSFKVFREAYLIAGDYPHQSMYMLQNLFNNWFTTLDIQKISAAAIMVAVVIFLFSVILQKVTKEEP
jgi:multiple sugar transport system permease protein